MKVTEDNYLKFVGKNVWLFLKNGKAIKEQITGALWESDDYMDKVFLTKGYVYHFDDIKEVKIVD